MLSMHVCFHSCVYFHVTFNFSCICFHALLSCLDLLKNFDFCKVVFYSNWGEGFASNFNVNC
jgi:hypothetical protein